jgi:antiviral helicase SKI2
MPKLECDVCSVDIERYYDLSLEVVGLNKKLCTMVTSSPSNANLFGPGRVVILRDGVRQLLITA